MKTFTISEEPKVNPFGGERCRRAGAGIARQVAWFLTAFVAYTFAPLLLSPQAIFFVVMMGPFFFWPLAGYTAKWMLESARRVRETGQGGAGAMFGLLACAVLFALFARTWLEWFPKDSPPGFGFGYKPAEVAAERIMWIVASIYSAVGALMLAASGRSLGWKRPNLLRVAFFGLLILGLCVMAPRAAHT